MKRNITRSINLAQEGRYGDAIRALTSTGCAPHHDKDVLDEPKQRHPERDPHVSDDMPPSLSCDSTSVLNALNAFPRSTSPGGSRLRPQHLLNAVAGSVSPASQTCLDQLTKFMCVTLSGSLNSLIAPWLIGAPLTALCKNNGGYRPNCGEESFTAFGKSYLLCSCKITFARSLVPYGQAGVGIKGDMEAAIHTLQTFIEENGNNEDLCCVKVDMANAFD